MAKQSGLGDNLYVHGHNLSGDIQALGTIGGGPAALDATGINKSANERLGGQRDGTIEATSFFNPGPEADAAHGVLSALPTSDVVLTYCRGTALGSPAACLVSKQIGYDGTRGDDGALTFAVQAQANGYGLEWGRLATAGVRADSAPANGTGIDLGAALAHGMQAYLHVLGVTGTSVTVTLQSSSDDGVADPYADIPGAAFTAVAPAGAPAAQRLAVAGAVERYVRVVTTGTFTAARLAVVVVPNQVEVAF